MKHPEREEWIPYVFDEAAPADRQRLQQHLDQCTACRDEIAGWQRSMGRLDSWKLPAASRPRVTLAPALAWAAAAAVLILVGASFGLGRLTATRSAIVQARAAIEADLRTEFARTLREEMGRSAAATLEAAGEQTKALLGQQASAIENRHAENLRAFSLALEKLEAQRLTDYVSLKKDLDTVAINTDAGLRHTEQELVQLTDVARPTGTATPSQN
jgi:hypothetical protein